MKIQIPVCVLLAGWLVVGCGDNGDTSPPPPPPPPSVDAMIDAVVDDHTLITIADGDVHGSVLGTSRQFLGIPYAKPPVGALRWKPPEKPAPWTTRLEAAQFGKRCAQLTSATLQNEASNEEDCLYLNVWTPAAVPATPLPVMVWFHGGGNVNGSASEPVPFVNRGVFYSGEFLAENHGVIVVSLNYRLGIFGFFDHGDLGAEGSTGNQGLLDQQLALHWVQDNIAKFGGDPANVTIFGESAGSFDVCMHVAAPSSRGLFHRAIGESGGCTTRQTSSLEGKAAATALATSVGCAPDVAGGVLPCLRAKSATELMASAAVAAGTGFGLDVDGTFMPDQPHTLYNTGAIAQVPYLLGSNTDEGTLFLGTTKVTTEVEYKAALQARLGVFGQPTVDAVAALYPVSRFAGAMPNPAEAALARVIGDSQLVCPTLDTAARVAHGGGSVYLYNFDIPAPIVVPGSYLGATHGSELPSVFGTSPAFTPETKAASDLMQRYWTQFARTGNPNGADLAWPAYTDTQDVRINFALQPTIVTAFRAAECAFWRSLYAGVF
jgi:para-nitrobenzyl esterase